MTYQEFLNNKAQLDGDHGFEPTFMPDMLFDFQKHLVEWATRKGRAAIFADCGLGKTPIQLTWAQNVVERENKPVLILTPLSVSGQTIHEGEKFGIDCRRVQDGNVGDYKGIVVTNYERLHHFKPNDFSGTVCDESGILKNFDGVLRNGITEFMRRQKFRLLCTATPAPNDYIELGTSSEAIGAMGCMDMLSRFFKRDNGFCRVENRGGQGWRFRGYAEHDFWRWVVSWARAVRMPSDMGFDDAGFILPKLIIEQHVIKANKRREGWLFDLPATNLNEQREERRRTLTERCEKVAELVGKNGACVCWCHLNPEGELLEKMISGSKNIEGSDDDDKKEEAFAAFVAGDIKCLITKPTIAGWGLNWQHCSHQTFFPSHSFEQWYQAIRRSWRFGQKKDVTIDIVASEGEADVLANLNRKAEAARVMFENIVRLMNNELEIKKVNKAINKEELPSWL
jgi:hypothetical protein